jgi:hypothetical protein
MTTITGRRQSYDFGTCNYNASAVHRRLERIFKVEETIFVFRALSTTRSVAILSTLAL